MYMIFSSFNAKHTCRTVSAGLWSLALVNIDGLLATDLINHSSRTPLSRVPVEWLVSMHRWPSWAADQVAELKGCQAEFGVSRTGVSKALAVDYAKRNRIAWCCMLFRFL